MSTYLSCVRCYLFKSCLKVLMLCLKVLMLQVFLKVSEVLFHNEGPMKEFCAALVFRKGQISYR